MTEHGTFERFGDGCRCDPCLVAVDLDPVAIRRALEGRRVRLTAAEKRYTAQQLTMRGHNVTRLLHISGSRARQLLNQAQESP